MTNVEIILQKGVGTFSIDSWAPNQRWLQPVLFQPVNDASTPAATEPGQVPISVIYSPEIEADVEKGPADGFKAPESHSTTVTGKSDKVQNPKKIFIFCFPPTGPSALLDWLALMGARQPNGLDSWSPLTAVYPTLGRSKCDKSQQD